MHFFSEDLVYSVKCSNRKIMRIIIVYFILKIADFNIKAIKGLMVFHTLVVAVHAMVPRNINGHGLQAIDPITNRGKIVTGKTLHEIQNVYFTNSKI